MSPVKLISICIILVLGWGIVLVRAGGGRTGGFGGLGAKVGTGDRGEKSALGDRGGKSALEDRGGESALGNRGEKCASGDRGGRVPGGREGGRDSATLRYLALGDSYTIGEAVGADDRYPEQVVKLLDQRGHIRCGQPCVIAATGWTTGNLLDALTTWEESHAPGDMADPARTYDFVSLLIGVNNQFQGRSQAEYAAQFELLLRQCIRLAGKKPNHVVVLSIPDYSVTPFGRMGDTALISKLIDSFNWVNKGLAEKYSVRYIDITAESRKALTDPSLIAADGLHFSGKEYGVWARLMAPVLLESLK